MKTISSELSKRLNDAGLLDNIYTEYYFIDGELERNENIDFRGVKEYYKALTLEEAIDFLPKDFHGDALYFFPNKIGYGVAYLREANNDNDCKTNDYIFCNVGKTLLEAIEKMLEYLLDNNLLTK